MSKKCAPLALHQQPEWRELTNAAEAHAFCEKVAYPCLMRPSYILSGVGQYQQTAPPPFHNAKGVA